MLDPGHAPRVEPTPTATTAASGAARCASTNLVRPHLPRREPFSEPETQNIRELVEAPDHQPDHHSFSYLELRPPGRRLTALFTRSLLYKALGSRMAATTATQHPVLGVSDDGRDRGLDVLDGGPSAYVRDRTIEFHPPCDTASVAEYLGPSQAAGSGSGGNREAYYGMLESTRKKVAALGDRPARRRTACRLRISKTFTTRRRPVWRTISAPTSGPCGCSRMRSSTATGEDGGARSPGTSTPSAWPSWPVASGASARGRGRPTSRWPTGPACGREHWRLPRGPARGVLVPRGGPARGRQRPHDVHIDWANPDTDWDVYV